MYSIEEILNRVFVNQSGISTTIANSASHILNTVYDTTKHALRVRVDGLSISGIIVSGGTYRSNATPLGAQDGSNDLFTLPNGDAYVNESLTVFLNGMAYKPSSVQELSPYTQFRIIGDTLPNISLGDAFYCAYQIKA